MGIPSLLVIHPKPQYSCRTLLAYIVVRRSRGWGGESGTSTTTVYARAAMLDDNQRRPGRRWLSSSRRADQDVGASCLRRVPRAPVQRQLELPAATTKTAGHDGASCRS